MVRLFALIGLMFVCVVGVGFYVGYFHVSWDSAFGTAHIVLSVDQQKIQEDEKLALEKAHNLANPTKELEFHLSHQ